MKLGTLLVDHELRHRISDAAMRLGIEPAHFDALDLVVAALNSDTFDAVVVPDSFLDFGSLLHALRACAGPSLTIVALGSGGTAAMSRAFQLGADDYFALGEGIEQLVQRAIARASAKLVRPRGNVVFLAGDYELDCAKGILASAWANVTLSPRELKLARLLFENRDHLVPLDRLRSELCGRVDASSKLALKQHVHTLRKKFDAASRPGTRGLDIESVFGAGYRLAY